MYFAQWEIPEKFIVYKTELTFVFTNLRPVLPGHLLISPIRRVQYFHDLTADERRDLLEVANMASKIMRRVLGTEAMQVTLQDGQEAGQTVPHLHIHIIPRNLPTIWKPPQKQPDDEREKATALYRSEFANSVLQEVSGHQYL